MAPWHSAKHQRAAWGGIGGGFPGSGAARGGIGRSQPAPSSPGLPTGTAGLLHLPRRKEARDAGGPTGRGGRAVALTMVLHRARPRGLSALSRGQEEAPAGRSRLADPGSRRSGRPRRPHLGRARSPGRP